MGFPSYNELMALSDDEFYSLQNTMSMVQVARKNRFRLGEKVTFIERGAQLEGTIVKLNPDTIDVWTGLCTWTKTPDQLKKLPIY